MLINAIDQTQSSLMIQAYSFTSAPIAKAVVEAKRRGVDVRVIVDKSQRTEKYSIVTFLNNAEIPVVVDSSVKIAHNKVMIFDQQAVFLGSFNFTKAAEHMNAENGMLIRGDASIVSAYTQNWKARYRVSEAP
ncbi:MAG: phospholipase D family protein [Rhizobium sp.]|nr:MAG: phospholipase D family protein [Rhizobium sp.]